MDAVDQPSGNRAEGQLCGDALCRPWRITGTLVHRQLREEGYEVGSTTVRAYLAEQRRQRQEVFVPLIWRPGDAAQVDFFEVTVEIAGERQKAWLFVVHLMYSGRDFAWLYERCNQIAFLDGHVRAFAHFGGVVVRCIYDNLKAAVKRRLGIERELNVRFLALCTHYLFEPCFARPGEGHDKGGVEARGKNVRLQHLTPIPSGASLAEIATELMEHLDAATDTRTNQDGRTVAQRFEEERRLLRALPQRPFEARHIEPVAVSRQALVRVDGACYSVPSHCGAFLCCLVFVHQQLIGDPGDPFHHLGITPLGGTLPPAPAATPGRSGCRLCPRYRQRARSGGLPARSRSSPEARAKNSPARRNIAGSAMASGARMATATIPSTLVTSTALRSVACRIKRARILASRPDSVSAGSLIAFCRGSMGLVDGRDLQAGGGRFLPLPCPWALP